MKIRMRTRCILSWFSLLAIICLYSPFGEAWKPSYSSLLRKIAATSLTTGLLLGSDLSPSHAAADEKQIEALKQVERVKVSLKYIQSDLEKASDAKPFIPQIKLLLRNYKFKENLQKGISLAEKGQKRDDAKLHANAAIDDLVLITEYFDGVDDPAAIAPKALKLTYDGAGASIKEVDAFFSSLPTEDVDNVISAIKEEFS